jgi:hypothetical protein
MKCPQAFISDNALVAHALDLVFTSNPNVFREHDSYKDEADRLQFWKDQGEAHVWEVLEQARDYTVLGDYGHGYYALFFKDQLIGWNKESICGIPGHDVVVLNKEYYGVSIFI